MNKLTFRHLSMVIALVIVIIAAAAAAGLRLPPAAPAPLDSNARFDTAAVLQVSAGSSLELPIVSASSADAVTATIISAAGASSVEVSIHDGAGSLTVGPPHTVRSGVITVSLPQTAPLTVRVTAGADDERLDINVGPTSIRSDESAMAIGLLTDQWGNPVPDGTTVMVTVTDAAGNATVVDVTTTSGLAVVELPAEGRGSQFTVAMSTDEAHTAAIEVHVRADRPMPFDLTVQSESALEADGRSVIVVQSTQLVDPTGRSIPDGTNVVLTMASPTGPTIITGEVIDGLVKATIIAPTQPGEVVLSADVNGATSSDLRIDFLPAVVTFTVEFDVVNGQRQLTIGPVVGPDGGLLPDGTVVNIGEDTSSLVNGQATHDLQPGETIPTVTVLGITGVIS